MRKIGRTNLDVAMVRYSSEPVQWNVQGGGNGTFQ